MKIFILILVLVLNSIPSSASTIDVERLADAIYLAEGGHKTKWPYGVKSVKTKNPRQVTINSIRNNLKRWDKAGRPGEFIHFMADRWCPIADDPKGNVNWKKNVTRLYAKMPQRAVSVSSPRGG